MRKLNRREIILLSVTLGVLAALAASSAVFNPLGKDAMNIDQEIKLTLGKIAKVERILRQEPQVKARMEHLKESIGVSRSESAEMSAVVSRVEAAASETNIHVVNMQPRRAVVKAEGVFYPVELQVNGPWVDIVRFLGMVQSKPSFFFIDELNLEKYGEGNGFLSGRLVLSRFQLSQDQNL